MAQLPTSWEGKTLEAIKFRRSNKDDGSLVYSLSIIDQTKLPLETIYDEVTCVEDGWKAIRQMRVRGAPAIAIVGVLSLVIEFQSHSFDTADQFADFVVEKLTYLVTARPTAVNMGEACHRLSAMVRRCVSDGADVNTTRTTLVREMEECLPRDIADNRAIGNHGADVILKGKSATENVVVLTHCNTGSLATAGYGTALGVIRALHRRGRLAHAYCTETRPYNQGARLTAYELVYEGIPATLICDSAAAVLMRTKTVDAVVVGADRVVANGDTANKIGTYQLAIVAHHHHVPYYIAAPKTSIDLNLADGDCIVIEERPPDEIHFVNGKRMSAPGIQAWNPAFDVAPASLIDAIITEVGVVVKQPESSVFDMKTFFEEN